MKSAVTFIQLAVMLGVVLLSFPACNGILGGIYDEASEEQLEFGFSVTSEAGGTGVVYVDATSYTKWIYIDFHALAIDSADITEEVSEPENWDIAIHRYDAKTNEASVLETGFTGLSTLEASGEMPEGDYIPDEWTTEQIVVDMSGMMDGVLGYAESYYNRELSKWLFVDTSSMPPSYDPSNKVYVIKLKDNTVAAVLLRNFMDAEGVKGYMTIDYIYPFEV